MPDDMTEVERLRKSVADLTDALGGWRELVEEIDDENSQLREVAKGMADAILEWYGHIDPALSYGRAQIEPKFSALFERLRELGIEVRG